MISLEEWTSLLWTFVGRQFEPTKKFYFCIEPKMLHDLSVEAGFKLASQDECVSSLRDACLTSIVRNEPISVLDQSVFHPSLSGRTQVICYAAQQVIAAERMMGDEAVSADSYYIRYREVIGLTGGEGIPIGYAIFKKIWKTFETELKALKEATSWNITFEEGTGKNKYRNYPISQSLLDDESLNRIHQRIRNINGISDESLILKVQNIDYKLTSRSARKIFIDAMRKGILRQIRTYEPIKSAVKMRPPNNKNHQEVITLDQFVLLFDDEDWDNEFFVVEFHPKENSSLVKEKGLEAFEAYLRESKHEPFVLFYFDKDRYRAISPKLAKDENVAISHMLVRENSENALEILLGSARAELLRKEEAILPQGLDLYACDENIMSSLGDHVDYALETIEFSGGILLNRVANTFLWGFPPTKISFGGARLLAGRLIEVNGEEKSVDEFLTHIADAAPTNYLVKYDKSEAKIRIHSSRELENVPRIGFPFVGNELAINAQYMGQGEFGLIHNVLFGPAFDEDQDSPLVLNITPSEIIKHLCVAEKLWVPAKANAIDGVVEQIKHVFGDSAQGRYWLRVVYIRQALPPSLL
jgi:hypothetical protein